VARIRHLGGRREHAVQLQAVQNALGEDSEVEVGLKTGARAALLLPNAYDRLMAYRQALEARFGEQPDNALVFQVLSKQGPLWYDDGFPVEWSADHYYRWTARVWRPARKVQRKRPTPRAGSPASPSTSCATPPFRLRSTRRS
jgi:hypothetical protein